MRIYKLLLKHYAGGSTVYPLNRLTEYMDTYIIEMKRKLLAIKSVQEFKFIILSYKILKKKRKLINYIGYNLLLNSEAKQSS
jgi:hypothetical protein